MTRNLIKKRLHYVHNYYNVQEWDWLTLRMAKRASLGHTVLDVLK
jgi:hypothetical protein